MTSRATPSVPIPCFHCLLVASSTRKECTLNGSQYESDLQPASGANGPTHGLSLDLVSTPTAASLLISACALCIRPYPPLSVTILFLHLQSRAAENSSLQIHRILPLSITRLRLSVIPRPQV